MDLSNHTNNRRLTRDDLLTLGVLCVIDKTNTVSDFMKNRIRDYESRRMLIKIEALNRGIIPSQDSEEIAAYLASVDHDERVRLKRRFRKLQRKFRKKSPPVKWLNFYGEKDETPNKLQKHRRKRLVFSELLNELNA